MVLNPKWVCTDEVYYYLGMVSASFAILFMKIKVEWHSVIFCSFGAFFGLIFGKSFNWFVIYLWWIGLLEGVLSALLRAQ
jgi:hypothetical protein